jgi:hypothetical protein
MQAAQNLFDRVGLTQRFRLMMIVWISGISATSRVDSVNPSVRDQ